MNLLHRGSKMAEQCAFKDFHDFFFTATRQEPYPYQVRMAEMEELPDLIEVPTGMGKTECAILSWLWRRRYADEGTRNSTARRLVYCLPMRTLVEQTQQRVGLWLDRLGLLDSNEQVQDVQLVKLMGGEVWADWDTRMERDQILIGTQDMLLSRALNRGYGMSKFRWPLHFGLFNNDCLWVMDEPQLMGAGLSTAAQMQWFRESFGTFGPTHTIWMSATVLPGWIRTTDFPSHRGLRRLTLEESDVRSASASKRLNAAKSLYSTEARMGEVKELANEILKRHDGSTTLVIMNTVKRAKELHKNLSSKKRATVLLLHSQYRPDDRKAVMDQAMNLVKEEGSNGPIIVSTQVVEAGVDISVKRLYTELAPWASLVQRFGRCNRRGEYEAGEVFLVLPDRNELMKLSPPYPHDHMEKAVSRVELLKGSFSSSSIPKDYDSPENLDIIRTVDLLELFDTTSDLFGNATDVSRFIRTEKETNAYVFWRDLKERSLNEQVPPVGHELCPVPIGELRDLVRKKKATVHRFDQFDGEWLLTRPEDIRPGDSLLMDCASGFYSPLLGWDAAITARVSPISIAAKQCYEGYGDDRPGRERTLEAHSNDVMSMAEGILSTLQYLDGLKKDVLEAALWHDVGKSHPIFQNMLGNENNGPILAKSRRMLSGSDYKEKVAKGLVRRYFRHELVSALMHLQLGGRFLPAYLCAAHHGKVRASIRAMPGERGPSDGRRFARGVWEGDVVPIPAFLSPPHGDLTLDLSLMDMGLIDGVPSWTENVMTLRDSKELGPFRLAFLEGLLKSADERASGGD